MHFEFSWIMLKFAIECTTVNKQHLSASVVLNNQTAFLSHCWQHVGYKTARFCYLTHTTITWQDAHNPRCETSFMLPMSVLTRIKSGFQKTFNRSSSCVYSLQPLVNVSAVVKSVKLEALIKLWGKTPTAAYSNRGFQLLLIFYQTQITWIIGESHW